MLRRCLALLLLLAPLYARADFVVNGTALPATKTNLVPVPPGVDPTKFFQASDYNSLAQASYDLRNGLLHGNLLGFLSQTPRPIVPVVTGPFLWADSSFSPPHLKFFNLTADVDLSAAGGGSVTSVGLSLPASTFNVSGSPVTNAGTLTGTFANQGANTVLAGPSSGSSTTPSWRFLTNADLPTPLIWFSPVNYASSGVVTAVFLAGNFTTGQLFYLTRAATITGARFYYPHGGTPLNVKVSLWDDTGVRVATVTVAANVAGIYSVTFSSSVSYSAPFKNWVVGIYETTGTEYYVIQNSQSPCYPGFCTATNAGQISSFQTTQWGPYELMLNPRDFAAGDNEPSSSPSSETYLVEPVYTVP